ncbi:MAG: chlorite dismutase family protein [Acidobacteriota bacterium]
MPHTYVNFVPGPLPPLPEGARVNSYRVKSDGTSMWRVETDSSFEVSGGLRGVVQHLHYTTADQRTDLAARSQTELPAGETTAVLIPIRKSPEWWQMAHDQRGHHFHGDAGHTAIGFPYADKIFRRLYHARYLGSRFDFLTYFEFPPEHEAAFRALLAELRATKEWSYVEEEYEVWMRKLS